MCDHGDCRVRTMLAMVAARWKQFRDPRALRQLVPSFSAISATAISRLASALTTARMARCTEPTGMPVPIEIVRTLKPARIRSSTIIAVELFRRVFRDVFRLFRHQRQRSSARGCNAEPCNAEFRLRHRLGGIVEQVTAGLDAGDVLVPGMRVHRDHKVGAAARAVIAGFGNALVRSGILTTSRFSVLRGLSFARMAVTPTLAVVDYPPLAPTGAARTIRGTCRGELAAPP